ncbi:MAG: hypothetical protein ACREA2_04930 [Blastocatellia bacterium]
MERVSAENRVFKCVLGERVTLKFTPHNTDLRVTFRFRNDTTPRIVQGDSLTFVVNGGQMELFVFFHFINGSGTGGSYEVELNGDRGGNFPDDPPVQQAGHLVPLRSYFFFA